MIEFLRVLIKNVKSHEVINHLKNKIDARIYLDKKFFLIKQDIDEIYL
jgi:hypothetical protein